MLPLDLNKVNTIGVVGLNAARCEFGDYSGTPVNAPMSVLDGIKNTFAKRNLEQYGDNAMFRTLIHAKRRAAEMSEVADTVEALGYGAEMSRAACTRLERLAGYDYARRIGLEQPKLKEVIDMVCADDLTEAQK